MARRLALAVAVVVALLPVAGAGGADAQTPKRGGTLVIADPEHFDPPCLNPLLSACSTNHIGLILSGAYEVANDATYEPDLAIGRIVGRRPFTLLYAIRPSARWSDGTPVTASDFVFTHKAVLGQRPRSHIHLDAPVRSVRALDAKHVRVVMREPFVDWRDLFPWVLPRHALAGQDLAKVWHNRLDNPRTGQPIGSGPFVVERLDPTRELVLRRNSRYWGRHLAYLDRIVFRFVPLADVAEALLQRKVDMINPGPGLFQGPALEVQRMPGVRSVTYRVAGWEHLHIRMRSPGHPALERSLVRQALAYGIDRVEIARVAHRLAGDRESRPEPLDSVAFLATSRHYRPNWKSYRYRPAHARELLEEAGCRRGADRVYVCAGSRLSLRFVTSAASERRQRTLELARDQLREAGVEVDLHYVPPGRLGPSLEDRNFDVFQFALGGGPSTAGPYDIFGCQRYANFSGYCDRLVTRDLERATRILDDERRVRLLNRIDARLAVAVPAIPLFQTMSLMVFDDTIRGVVANGFNAFTWNAEDWWLDD